MVKVTLLALGMGLLAQVMAQACPSTASTAQTCLYGFQGPAAALPILTYRSSTTGTAWVVSAQTGVAGSYCVRFTTDCAVYAAVLNNPLLNATNCPPGQPVVMYTYAMPDSATNPNPGQLATCSSMTAQIAQYQGQNATLCGSTDCNLQLVYPPTFTPFGICPTTAGSATTCYSGATGPTAAAAAAFATAVKVGAAVGPIAVPSGSLCASGTFPCSKATSYGLSGLDASTCPAGQNLTVYMNVTLDKSNCIQQALAYQNFAVCSSTNCNNPGAAGKASGAVTQSPGFTSTWLSAIVLALAWPKK